MPGDEPGLGGHGADGTNGRAFRAWTEFTTPAVGNNGAGDRGFRLRMRDGTAVEPERNRSAGAGRPPHPELRSLVARDYAGFRDGGGHHLVLPASASVPLIVKIEDSPVRPPEFAMGARDSFLAVEGACAPAYLNVWLAPLGRLHAVGAAHGPDRGADRRPGRPARRRGPPAGRDGARRPDLGCPVHAGGPVPAPSPGAGPPPVPRGRLGVASPAGDRGCGPDRRDRPGGGLEPQAPHHPVPPADRADAQGGRPAGALRRRLAAPRSAGLGVGPVVELEPGGGRGRLRRPGPPHPRLPAVHRDHPDRVPGQIRPRHGVRLLLSVSW